MPLTRLQGMAAVHCLGAILLMLGPAGGADLDTARQAYQAGDFPKALAELQPLGRSGDARAEMVLGQIYALGQGVPKDLKWALFWTLRAKAHAKDADTREKAQDRCQKLEQKLSAADIAAVKAKIDQVNTEPAPLRGSATVSADIATRGADVATSAAPVAPPASAARPLPSLQEGLDLFDGKDYLGAITALTPHADNGDPRALMALGMIYDQGLGVTEEPEKAVTFYTRAAEKGLTPAMFNLAHLYRNGRGVDANPQEAARMYVQAADLGNIRACLSAGISLENGEGVAVDLEKAAQYYLKGAEMGEPSCQFNIAVCYGKGQGAPLSREESYRWLLIAQKNPALPTHLKESCEKLVESLGLDFFPEDLTRIQQEAAAFVPQPPPQP